MSPAVRRTLEIALDDHRRSLTGWQERRDIAQHDLTRALAEVARLEQTVADITAALDLDDVAAAAEVPIELDLDEGADR